MRRTTADASLEERSFFDSLQKLDVAHRLLIKLQVLPKNILPSGVCCAIGH